MARRLRGKKTFFEFTGTRRLLIIDSFFLRGIIDSFFVLGGWDDSDWQLIVPAVLLLVLYEMYSTVNLQCATEWGSATGNNSEVT